ncbi:hypothetical protein [Thorsellia anophelis]|uniref:Uncharacterized protein n=1 Tax=Thorsellia anophelis DSM 18579 TaxID=1123402 RepID=A0A1I0CKK6_9GAMM|nr:hypothetical protein [Thorsellia anophelis]SET20193.1 hypothetical protein SAMN02583745_01662 [Thorsellia anophelis DSM 18579]
MKSKYIKYLIYAALIFIFYQVMQIICLLLIIDGNFIPERSNILFFEPTVIDEGSGGYWIYGEDNANYYYFLNDAENTYMFIKKNNNCINFDKQNFNTWCKQNYDREQ